MGDFGAQRAAGEAELQQTSRKGVLAHGYYDFFAIAIAAAVTITIITILCWFCMGASGFIFPGATLGMRGS